MLSYGYTQHGKRAHLPLQQTRLSDTLNALCASDLELVKFDDLPLARSHFPLCQRCEYKQTALYMDRLLVVAGSTDRHRLEELEQLVLTYGAAPVYGQPLRVVS